ncbi:hypothetical protein C8Q80DRAFT_1207971 [Daedaleopsis nitida]|nr:hypothetical protein C8Q80DRAFT_1207971 [Daedaleopsis nitida]
MATVAQLLFNLPTNPSVKWLATQERNLNRELPYPDPAAETPEEYVFRTYLQFLWLPQSIMPLRFLIPSLLRVTSTPSSPSTSQSPTAHPLHSPLGQILLTSRAASQKYHTRIPELLAEENEPADSEEEYVWYAYHKDKVGGEDAQPQDGQDEYEAQERLKHVWLEKFERREWVPHVLSAPPPRARVPSHKLARSYALFLRPAHRPGSRYRSSSTSSSSRCPERTQRARSPRTHGRPSPRPSPCRRRCRRPSQRSASAERRVRGSARRRRLRSRSRSAWRATWTNSRCGSSCTPSTARSPADMDSSMQLARVRTGSRTGETGCRPSARTSSNPCSKRSCRTSARSSARSSSQTPGARTQTPSSSRRRCPPSPPQSVRSRPGLPPAARHRHRRQARAQARTRSSVRAHARFRSPSSRRSASGPGRWASVHMRCASARRCTR